jgi:hypothetical protein
MHNAGALLIDFLVSETKIASPARHPWKLNEGLGEENKPRQLNGCCLFNRITAHVASLITLTW